MKLVTLAALAALSVTSAGCVANRGGGMTASMTAVSAMEFTTTATVSNTFEIETSRLAVQRSRDPEVRRFAREMIRDHTAAASRMNRVARRAGMPPMRPRLDRAHEAMLAELQSAPAGNFNAVYVTMQNQAHSEAITLFSAYGQSGDQPQLRAFAMETLPTLEKHADHLRMIGGAPGGMMRMSGAM